MSPGVAINELMENASCLAVALKHVTFKDYGIVKQKIVDMREPKKLVQRLCMVFELVSESSIIFTSYHFAFKSTHMKQLYGPFPSFFVVAPEDEVKRSRSYDE